MYYLMRINEMVPLILFAIKALKATPPSTLLYEVYTDQTASSTAKLIGPTETILPVKHSMINETVYYSCSSASILNMFVHNIIGKQMGSSNQSGASKTLTVKDNLILFNSEYSLARQYLYNLQYSSSTHQITFTLTFTVSTSVIGQKSIDYSSSTLIYVSGYGKASKLDTATGIQTISVAYGANRNIYRFLLTIGDSLLVGNVNISFPLLRRTDLTTIKEITTTILDIYSFEVNNLNDTECT